MIGGASGIGRALSEELGRKAAAMIVAANLNSEGAQVVKSITRVGGQARAISLYASRAEYVQCLVDEIPLASSS